MMNQKIDQLSEVVLREIGGRMVGKRLVPLLRLLFSRQAREFSRLLLALEDGLDCPQPWLTARATASALSGGLEIRAQERVPAEGPLLALANHPGMADAIAAFGCLPRADTLVVAGRTPILTGLPNISRRLIYLPENKAGGMVVLRAMVDWLRKGGAVFYFPYGLLEPDPARVPGAANTLQAWSGSIGAVLSRAPETKLLPMLISGVLSKRAWESGLLSQVVKTKRRHQLAMIWQFIRRVGAHGRDWDSVMRVDIGQSLPARSLSARLDPAEINAAARAAFGGLLTDTFPEDPGMLPVCDYVTPA